MEKSTEILSGASQGKIIHINNKDLLVRCLSVCDKLQGKAPGYWVRKRDILTDDPVSPASVWGQPML